ncbi:fumarate/nitrate reduction transcriptional regulator Fnr [Billgrantia diversa]|nr:fumarate/nitrate reduction transcriptional regulator Fnr [Halomonas sp. MCCC 1A13316]
MHTGGDSRTPLQLYEFRKACSSCSLRELCLPVALSGLDIDALDKIVKRKGPLQKGDKLIRPGQPMTALHAVLSGSLKSSTQDMNDEEQIIAFHLPGELIGLDAIGSGKHSSTTEALETTSVCSIPFAELEALAHKIPSLQHQLLRIMSREIFDDHELLQVSRRPAEQRLAVLLLNFSQRFGRRGMSRTRFRLPMSRQDLGNYLGLAPETTSRIFRRFVIQGLLSATGKEIELLDLQALHGLKEESGGNTDLHAKRS